MNKSYSNDLFFFSRQPIIQTTGGELPKDVSRHPAVRELLPEVCGVFTEEKITRGNNASLFEFPWMALLGYVTSKI